MAGTALQIDLQAMETVRRRIQALGSTDLSPLVADIAATVESQTRRRLGKEKRAPDGSAWAPWSEGYRGRRMLERSGALIDSIHHKLYGDQAEVGSNLVYAAIHQFGGAEVGKAIPARPYLGLSDDNMDELAETVDAWIERQFR
jgi:phage virion morphogenesis protein